MYRAKMNLLLCVALIIVGMFSQGQGVVDAAEWSFTNMTIPGKGEWISSMFFTYTFAPSQFSFGYLTNDTLYQTSGPNNYGPWLLPYPTSPSAQFYLGFLVGTHSNDNSYDVLLVDATNCISVYNVGIPKNNQPNAHLKSSFCLPGLPPQEFARLVPNTPLVNALRYSFLISRSYVAGISAQSPYPYFFKSWEELLTQRGYPVDGITSPELVDAIYLSDKKNVNNDTFVVIRSGMRQGKSVFEVLNCKVVNTLVQLDTLIYIEKFSTAANVVFMGAQFNPVVVNDVLLYFSMQLQGSQYTSIIVWSIKQDYQIATATLPDLRIQTAGKVSFDYQYDSVKGVFPAIFASGSWLFYLVSLEKQATYLNMTASPILFSRTVSPPALPALSLPINPFYNPDLSLFTASYTLPDNQLTLQTVAHCTPSSFKTCYF